MHPGSRGFLSVRMVLFLLRASHLMEKKTRKKTSGSRVKFGRKRKTVSVSTTVLSSPKR